MKLTGNTILITGGATGIGFELAISFINHKNTVIICGRREHKLREAKKLLPAINTRICDISDINDCKELYDWILAEFGEINILINNAGIQREIHFKDGVDGLPADDEIAINLSAPVYLSALFAPLLMKQPESAIVNISSGLAFVPLAIYPVYCATKAALHSFSISLRHQLKDTSVNVFEVIVPTVDSDLNNESRDRRGMTDRGISPKELAQAFMAGFQNDEYEMPVGMAKGLFEGSKNNFDVIFNRMNH